MMIPIQYLVKIIRCKQLLVRVGAFHKRGFTIFLLLLLTMGGKLSAEKKNFAALSIGYQGKMDSSFEYVYGSHGMPFGTVELGRWINKHLAIEMKSHFLYERGKSSAIDERVSLFEMPFLFCLKGALRKGEVHSYLSFGFGPLFYWEKTYMGSEKGTIKSYEGEIGLEYLFSKKAYFLLAISYLYAYHYFPEVDEGRNIGGLGGRIGFGFPF